MSEQSARVAQRTGWLTFNLRWLLVVAAAVLVLSDPAPASMLAVALLLITGIYNFGLTLYEFADPGRPWHIWLTLAMDFTLGLALYFGTGGAAGRLIWLGLLPGLTATLRFEWPVPLGMTAAFLAAQAVVGWLITPADVHQLVTIAAAAALMLPITLVIAMAARRLRTRIENSVQRQYQVDHARSQVLRQHARAIYEMSSMVSATMNYKEVLEAALNFGALGAEGRQPSSSGLVSAVLFFEEDQLHVTSSRRLTAADLRVVCPGRTGILGDVIRTGQPAICSDPSHDPELVQFASFQACRAAMVLALRAGYETYGVVIYGHPRANFFDEDQKALLVAVVNQAIIALQNAQLYRSLREEKERLIDVQEEAQKKLARDLHDGPTQAVAALAMRANFVRRLLERDPKAAGEELFKMEDLGDEPPGRAVLHCGRGGQQRPQARSGRAHLGAAEVPERCAHGRNSRRRRRLQRRRGRQQLQPARQPGHGQHARARRDDQRRDQDRLGRKPRHARVGIHPPHRPGAREDPGVKCWRIANGPSRGVQLNAPTWAIRNAPLIPLSCRAAMERLQ